jgi:hypothetical protein
MLRYGRACANWPPRVPDTSLPGQQAKDLWAYLRQFDTQGNIKK